MSEVYKPDIKYFKALFPIFAVVEKANSTGEIAESLITDLIDGVSIQVSTRLERLGFLIPTKENKLPYLNLKNYICFSVANILRFQFVGSSEVLKDLDIKVKELEESYLKDLSKTTSTIQSVSSVELSSSSLKP